MLQSELPVLLYENNAHLLHTQIQTFNHVVVYIFITVGFGQ